MIQAEPKQTPPQQSSCDKASLALKIRKYIDHCHFVCQNSKASDRMVKLINLDSLKRGLYPMVKHPENYSLKEISQFTLLSHRHLLAVLPSLLNDSYQSSLTKLEEIINQCKQN